MCHVVPSEPVHAVDEIPDAEVSKNEIQQPDLKLFVLSLLKSLLVLPLPVRITNSMLRNQF